MSTILQQNLAKEIVKNVKRKKPLNKGKLLEMAGYTKTVAEATPTKIMEQAGVTEALEDLGFSVEGAKRVVQQIMYSEKTEPNARLRATDQVFKVHGTYADGDKPNNNILIINVSEAILKKNNLTPNDINTSSESNSGGHTQVQSN